MIYINTILLIFILYLLWTIKNIRVNKVIDDLKKSHYVLDKPKEIASYSEVDSEHQTLKDVIESIKLENWVSKIEENSIGMGMGKYYEIEFKNPTGTISMDTALYLYTNSKKDSIDVRRAYIRLHDSSSYKSIKIDESIAKVYLTNFLWDVVLEYHQNRWDKTSSDMKDTLLGINQNLKSINRDRQLKKLI